MIWRLRLPGMLSDKTICVSHSIRERLIGDYRYSKSKTVVIHNGVDLRRYAPSRNPLQKAHGETSLDCSGEILLSIANLTHLKRIDVALEAVRLVVKARPSCRYIIVGGGNQENTLRAQSRKLGLAGVVQFVGQVDDVRTYLEQADVFLLSSDNEGLPLVLGEAMACGIPCIATNVGGNKEIVSHGETGLLIPSGSPEQLAEAIEYLLAHPEERRRMGDNARRRVQEHFNIEDSMRQIKQVCLEGHYRTSEILPTAVNHER
jgi:glycosyltransferase involved in cell wall biosynthesis